MSMDDSSDQTPPRSHEVMDSRPMTIDDLNVLLATAHPRLARFANAQGVTPDAIDDVVQETLLEAWSHLDHLRSPERFQAWLYGVCRNVCLRWKRSYGLTSQRQESLSDWNGESTGNKNDIIDPFALDPADVLDRQGLTVLLDRALTHLPALAREAVQAHYLAELPKDEAAARLGLTIKALEVRLHRARLQLREVLKNELRSDAEQFGLAFDAETASRWRNTRIWCIGCGRQHMSGLFEPLPDGRINLRMRCPVCSQPDNFDIVCIWGLAPLENRSSFRPALKRSSQAVTQYYLEGLANGHQKCPVCQGLAQIRGIAFHRFPFPFLERLGLLIDCCRCGTFISMLTSAVMSYPAVQQFIAQHPRSISEPEAYVMYAGQEAFRIRFVDLASSARISIFLLRKTAQLIGIEQE